MTGVIFLGPPGSGKGTVASKICKTSASLDHFSMGDVFRKLSHFETKLGKTLKEILAKGNLVDDRLVMQAVEQYIKSQGKDKIVSGFFFDGIPRTIEQSKQLDKIITIKKVFLFVISDEQVLNRLTNRLTCKGCNATYNNKTNPPKISNQCNECKTTLVIREDDGIEIAKNRLEIYRESSQEIIKYYEEQKKLVEVNATLGVDQVTTLVAEKLS